LNELRIQPAAVEDAETAAEWYETHRPGLGIEFILELDAALEKAVETPEAYELKYRKVRRVLTRRFPYAVYFVLESNVVEVFAILHQHRDPSTWQSRAQ
jgi:plasmid stabilization system protein ParE